MMTYLDLGICVIDIILVGQIRELGSCLEIHYLALDCLLASLIFA